MNSFRKSMIASAVGLSLGIASQAYAAVDAYLVINGTPQPSTPLMPGINVLSFSWGASNTGSVSVQAPNPGTGLLFDAGAGAAITMMSTAPGTQTLDITETGLMSMPDRFAEPAGKGIDLGMLEIVTNRLLRLQMPRSCQHRFECRKLGRGQTMGEPGFAADAAIGPRSRRRDRIAEWGHRDVSVAVCLSFRPIGPHGNVGHATSGGGEQP